MTFRRTLSLEEREQLELHVKECQKAFGTKRSRMQWSDDDLSYLDMCHMQLKAANFAKVSFVESNLSNVNLRNANLISAVFDGATLIDADLRNTDLRSAYINAATLLRTNLKGACLAGAQVTDTNLCGANLKETILQYANFEGSNFTGAHLTKADLRSAYFTSANFTKANFIGSNAIASNFQLANFSKANLMDASFDESDMKYANLREAYLVGTSLTNVYLREADLTGAIFGDDHQHLAGADLTGAKLSGFVGLGQVPMVPDLLNQLHMNIKGYSKPKSICYLAKAAATMASDMMTGCDLAKQVGVKTAGALVFAKSGLEIPDFWSKENALQWVLHQSERR